MRTIRVYADTSVFGGVFDEEFSEPSRRFFGRVVKGEFALLLSMQVVEELAPAPEQVRRALLDLPADCVETVAIDPEATALADAYMEAGTLGRSSRMDALHVAVATVAGADVIVSWNFAHIVNYDRIRMFNGVNVLRGYRPVDIRSPLEMGYEEEHEDV